MTRKALAMASALLILTFVVAGLIAGATLPADAELPIHWNLQGEADGWANKWFALMLPAGLTAAMALLFYALPALEPKEQGLERSQGLYLWGWASVLLVMGFMEVAVLSVAVGWDLSVTRLMMAGLGLMLMLIGNQLGKSRPMYLIGLRTPWTLASEEVWIRTHRLGGKLMLAGGVVLLAGAVIGLRPELLAAILFGTAAIGAGVPTVYSYLLWRGEKRRGQPSE